MSDVKIFAFADEASANLVGQIAAMRRNQLDGLEIRNVDGVNVSDMTLEHARAVRAQMDDAGLKVWSIGSPIGKIDVEKDDFDAHLDKFRHTLEVAEALGAKNIRLFSFYIPSGRNPADFRGAVMDRMGAMLDAAQGTGLELCHENEKGIYGDMADRCADLHRTFPALRAVFDPANFIQCGQDTWQAWALLKPYVKYLHVKDALADGNVVPAGKGIGNVARIVGEYLAMGGLALTLEPHLKVFDGLEALERASNNRPALGSHCYASNDEAFDAACAALKDILQEV